MSDMDTKQQGKLSGRSHAIDILKSIAIFGVIVIHTAASGLSGYKALSFEWFSVVFWGTLIRFSVPVFFMCSGALMLDPKKEITIKKLWTKYLPRILAALFFWAAAYMIPDIVKASRAEGLSPGMLLDYLKDLVLFRHHFHLYFLHIIILFYALLPLSRIVTRFSKKSELRYILAVWFVLGVLYPFLRLYSPFSMLGGIPAQYALNLTYCSVGYGLLGFYIKKYAAARPSRWLLLYLAGFVLTFAGMTATNLSGTVSAVFWEGGSPGVAMMAAGIFGFFSSRQPKAACPKAFVTLSLASFCIYLVHDFFNIIFRHFGLTITLFAPALSIPALSLAVLGLSFCVYLLLSKIPFVNRYLI